MAVTSLVFAVAGWDMTSTNIIDGYDPWWKMLLVGGVLTLFFIHLTCKFGRLWLKERDERVLKEVMKDE